MSSSVIEQQFRSFPLLLILMQEIITVAVVLLVYNSDIYYIDKDYRKSMKLFKPGFSNLDKRSKFLYMGKNYF